MLGFVCPCHLVVVSAQFCPVEHLRAENPLSVKYFKSAMISWCYKNSHLSFLQVTADMQFSREIDFQFIVLKKGFGCSATVHTGCLFAEWLVHQCAHNTSVSPLLQWCGFGL